jgi:hypothetical protein
MPNWLKLNQFRNKAARVRPFIDELIWNMRALASPRGRSVQSGSP